MLKIKRRGVEGEKREETFSLIPSEGLKQNRKGFDLTLCDLKLLVPLMSFLFPPVMTLKSH